VFAGGIEASSSEDEEVSSDLLLREERLVRGDDRRVFLLGLGTISCVVCLVLFLVRTVDTRPHEGMGGAHPGDPTLHQQQQP
jgi:hypothetical protein